jgi:hypothetical protein
MGAVGRILAILMTGAILLALETAPPLVVMSSPAQAQDATAAQIADLEKRVAALEQLLKAQSAPKPAPNPNAAAPPQGAPQLRLLDWTAARKKGDFGETYLITYSLANDYKQAVKLVDGEVAFSDLLGETVYTIRLTKDVTIAAGGIAVESGQYPINQFLPREERLGQLAKADVAAKLILRAVVFTDNTIAKFEN